MSEDSTAETNNSRSFEDRVFARFDAIDDRFERIEGRLGTVEIRIGKLEARQNDTKPIWEQALAAIAETNAVMLAGFDDFRRQFESINARLDSMDARFDSMDARFDLMDARFDLMDARFDLMDARFDSMDARFDSMDSRFTVLETDLENGLRGVERKIDVLNQYILALRADQRYVDSRLEKLESQGKPS
jgi:chromosome segregation ATPase